MIDVDAYLREKSTRTDAALKDLIAGWVDAPPRLVEAARYSLFAGGKRLRPALALGACEMLLGDDTPALPAACALEMIHTYSLIHDDLPAMDNDDLRRGRPTSHRVFGEAAAILAGDALLTMAFDAAAEAGAGIVREIAQAAGIAGMVGGQLLDMDAEGRPVTLGELRCIHACKTGALIRAAVRCGALCGGANPEQLAALTLYGEHTGLAFQIADDILDVTGEAEKLGKNTGADAAHTKATYPGLLGLDGARRLAGETVDAALDALSGFDEEAEPFRALARFIISRDH